jgi:mono/diheme cytochrome c family protein
MIRKILLGLAALVVLAVGGVAAFFFGVLPKTAAPRDVKAEATPEALARGEYLGWTLGCVGCHSPIDESRPGDWPIEGQLLAGRVIPGDPEGPLKAFHAPNLTPDPTTGVGGWTDGELMRAIREGVSKDGRVLFPMMNYPAFRHLTDEDTLAIIAWMRQHKPIQNEVGLTEIPFPISMFIRAAPAPVEGSPEPLPTDPLARGNLLLKLSSCNDCHTQMDKGQYIEGLELAGGTPFKGPFGTVFAKNITPDEATGIGTFSDADLVRVFREGKGKDGRDLWVMPSSAYKRWTEEDLQAVITALRAVKPVSNMVPPDELTAK